jgi:hypothetical protein
LKEHSFRSKVKPTMFDKLREHRLKTIAILSILVIIASAVTVAVPVNAKPDHPIKSEHTKANRTTIFGKGASFTITGTGTAYDINDQTKTVSADLHLTATAERVTFGVAKISVNGGTIKVGSDTFTVEKGTGRLNVHGKKILLHVELKDGSGKIWHLILYGKISSIIPKTLANGASLTVDFMKSQSKVAGKWFLSIPSATITRTA